MEVCDRDELKVKRDESGVKRVGRRGVGKEQRWLPAPQLKDVEGEQRD